MRKFVYVLLISSLTLLSLISNAQTIGGWESEYSKPKAFITNVGQFDQAAGLIHLDGVEYAYDGTNQIYYFTKTGLVIELSQKHKVVKTEEEKAEREARKQQPFTTIEWQDFESVGNRITYNRDVLSCDWIGSNSDVELIAENANSFYHSYTFNNVSGTKESVDHVLSYTKLTYKNLYDNIDVIYEFHPENGIKYSVIVYPGGDLSNVKLKYSKDASLLPDGTIHTPTIYGDIIDHAPVTFYDGNQNQIISSSYIFEDNTISFSVSDYDQTKILVVDPWTATPTFASNWDCVWECEKDALGNVYIIGGVTPLQLIKYNAAGAIQWTYSTPYDTTMWLGCFATDDAGNSYVTNGSTAAIQKISTAGAIIWDNPSPGGIFGSTEFWNIAFNCDQTMLVIGGTGGFLPPLPYIYNMDMTSGNVISSVQVCGSTISGFPPNTQEVRSITATANEKYYFITHDTIGFVDQNLTLCPGQSAPFHVNNGYDLGYKCDNWRYNNTGVEAIAYYDGFVYVNRGNQIDKRDFNTAAIVATAPIPAGSMVTVFGGGNQLGNSGIEIDACGNIFVGSINQVVKYDANLVQLATFPTTFNVYDISVSTGGNIIAAGSTGNSGSASRTGAVMQIAGAACAPQTIVCCNPFICPVLPLCDTDPSVTLATDTPGGTWSIAPATPGFNTVTGVFNPAIAAAGTYTVTYTLLCGFSTTTITVSACSAMTVCEELDGTFTVTGGSPTYTWAEGGMTGGGCVAGFAFCAGPFTDAAPPTFAWTNFATGVNVTLPVGADTVKITDGLGTILTFNPNTIGPCVVSCDATITPAGPFCVNDAAVNLVAATTGGTWSGTGITNASNGTFNPATAGAGTFTITYTLLCGSSDTESITVNALTTPTFAAVAAICSGDPLAPLPTTSTNAITGTWSPAINNTATTLYTFTPTAGQCAGTTTMTITVNPNVTPTFAAVAPICSGAPLAPLPTTSTNSITGTWSPAINNTATTLYTFTPTAGQCATTTTLTITVNPADNSSFTYSSGSFCITDPNPLPTITGLAGGTFTINGAGIINASTGEIDIAGSGNGTYTTTYTTNGSCPTSTNFDVTITSGADATITTAGPFCANDAAVNLVGADAGGAWTGTGITDGVLGTFDPATAGAGTFTITYTIGGGCGDVDTENITVNAADNSAFTYPATVFCTADVDPIATTTGTPGGIFTIDNGGTINSADGTIDLDMSGVGAFIITYTTSGPCPSSSTFNITITAGGDPTITAAGPFCVSDLPVNLVAVDAGGTWTGTGITDGVLGTFDPSVAGIGTHTITYSLPGGCGTSDTEDIIVTSGDNASFSYSSAVYCLTDPNPSPTITGTPGGTFTISGAGIINSATGEINIGGSGAGTFTITYTTNGTCPANSAFDVTLTNSTDATITAAGPFCADDPSVILNAATAGGTWSGTGITNPATGAFDPSVAGAGSHTITYTIAGSCGATDTQIITVNPVDGAAIFYAQTNYCTSDLDPFVSITGTFGGTFTMNGGGVINSVTGTIDLSATAAGSYTVTYTTNGACPAIATFAITISTTITADILEVGPYCLGSSDVTLTGAPGGGTWQGTGIWDLPNGIFNADSAGVGSHEIIYSISGSCGDDDTIFIDVSDFPIAVISTDTTIFIGDEVELFASGGSTYFWYDDQDISCTDCQYPVVDPLSTTTYCAVVTNSFGCSDTACVVITVDQNCGDLFVPNAFSPNDMGGNNLECVYGRCIVTMTFTIYDRWGEKVFVTENQDICWDGIFRGKEMNSGIYVYVLNATLLTGEVVEKKGNITLVR